MQTHPSNQDENTTPNSAGTTPTGTPQYGEFGHADDAALTPEQLASRPAGTNPGGVAAPSYVEPEQRGSVPQNLDPQAVRDVKEAEYDEQREGWAKDDPRYAGGTRNWPTAEPANKTTSTAEQEGNDGRKVSNDGSNDNPDEFSALRHDDGKGIPGK
jgi:hypothetical protein